MDVSEFERIFEEQVSRIRGTLIAKAKEYADDGDRLHNFKQAAHLNHETQEQALWGMNTKHIVSLADMIASSGETFYPMSVWEEKLGDYLVYGFLLRAVVQETNDGLTSAITDDQLYSDAFTNPDVQLTGSHRMGIQPNP